MSIDATHFVGVAGPARAFVIAQAAAKHPRLVVIVKDRAEIEALEADLSFFLDDREIIPFPAWDTLPFEPVSPQLEISAQRNGVRTLLRNSSTAWIVLVPADALLQLVLPWELIAPRAFTLTAGKTADSIESIAKRCRLAHYAEVSVVETVGELAIRGEVVDIFPPLAHAPIRIAVDSSGCVTLREFDPESQRTTKDAPLMHVIPAHETVPWHLLSDTALRASAVQRIIERGKECEVAPREAQAVVDGWLKGADIIPGSELFHATALAPLASFFDECATHGTVISCDRLGIEQQLASVDELARERHQRLTATHQFVPTFSSVYLDAEQVLARLKQTARISIDPVEMLEEGEITPAIRVNVGSHAELSTRIRGKVGTGKAFAPLVGMISKLRREGYEVGFVVGSRGRAERLQATLLESNLAAEIVELSSAQWLHARRGPLSIVEGHLTKGLMSAHTASASENSCRSKNYSQRLGS
jgi:transcription-repair coupling factor (superfamily II helicase)